MNIIVTGAAGFVGSSLVDRLLSFNHSVIGIDNFSTGFNEFLINARQHKNFRLLNINLLDFDSLLPIFINIDAVFHMAANADIRGGVANPKRDLEQNTLVTFNVLEAMRKSGTRRIIFSSTAAALGEPIVFPTPEDCAIPNQTSFYGASKMACEGLISSFCSSYGFEAYVFRFVSLLGPRYPHGHVFDFVKKLKLNPKKLEILGDGLQRKSFIHIDDCISAMLLIGNDMRPFNSKSGGYSVYHLGSSSFCTIKQSAAWICKELHLDPEFEFSGGERGWIGDSPFVFLDTTKVRALGWIPTISIEDSVKITARWLNENPWILRLSPRV